MLLFIICFIAGLLTVFAPCILPILPIIIGGNLSSGKLNYKKVFTIIISLAVSVIVFNLLLKSTTYLIVVPQIVWQYISGGIIILVGLYTFLPNIWQGKFISQIKKSGEKAIQTGNNQKSLKGDILVGAALGPVFSTCSPTYFIVLASILPVNFALGIIYLLAFVLGLSVSLLLVTILGFRLINFFDLKAGSIKILEKVIAVLFILTGIFIISGYDKVLQTKILDAGYFDITKIENKLLNYNNSDSINKNSDIDNIKNINQSKVIDIKSQEIKKQAVIATKQKSPEITKKVMPKYEVIGNVKELSDISGYINVAEGETLQNILSKNKVVLFEFWTYDCINCRRTIPHLNSWYDKYHDQGLEIVGVHTPEFSYEQIKSNVEKKVREYGIKFPVFMDNEYSTWNSYNNKYWPMRYLILPNGDIIYSHAGEGDYENNEDLIKEILNQ